MAGATNTASPTLQLAQSPAPTPTPTPTLSPNPSPASSPTRVSGFVATGSLVTGRQGQTATRLPNGRVLISGGMTDGGGADTALSSAELYDPNNGTFSPTGSLHVGRVGHTATLLSNGRVLIAGGGDVGDSAPDLASAELYDPKTGTFSSTGSMTPAQGGTTATLLVNGRVLMAGGSTDASAELYDPKTGTFSSTGSMTPAQGGTTATLLVNGRVLMAGGSTDASAELYDPKTGTFSSTGSMTPAQGGTTATLLVNGRVLMAGGMAFYPGSAFGAVLAWAELYDPKNGTFSPTGSMASARGGATATLLTDGRVLVAGGLASPNYLASAELYDPKTGAFVESGSMVAAREDQTATLLDDGRVLIAGGMDWPHGSAPEYLASAELYQP